MLKKLLSLLLIATIFSPFVIARGSELPEAPSATQAKVKADLEKFAGEQKKVKLTLKDASRLTGHVKQAGDEEFQFKDARSGDVRKIAYGDVTEARKAGMSRAAKILIAVGIGAGAAVGMTVIACKTGAIHCQ